MLSSVFWIDFLDTLSKKLFYLGLRLLVGYSNHVLPKDLFCKGPESLNRIVLTDVWGVENNINFILLTSLTDKFTVMESQIV